MSNPENDLPVVKLNPDQAPMSNMLDAALQLVLGDLRETGIPLGTIRTICYGMAFLSLSSPKAWEAFQEHTMQRPGDGAAIIRTLTGIADEVYRPIAPGFPPIPQPDPDPASPDGEG